MRFGVATLVLLLLPLGGPRVARAAAGAVAEHESTLEVLLIGNSFVYYNNLPAILEGLAASLDGPRISASMIVEGGASLTDHLERGDAERAIRDGDWDFVVLLGQSTFGRVFLVEGRYRVGGYEEFLRAGRRLHDVVSESGAETILLSHWKDRDAPASDQAAITAAYRHLARETGAAVAPVGAAFSRGAVGSPSIRLYTGDEHHPGPPGTYLAAAVLYGTMTGRSPEGATGTVEGHPVDADTGAVLESKVRLVDLPPAQAAGLQRLAWDAVLGEAEGVGSGPPAIALPGLPDGQPIDASDLEGRWEGPLRLYPWSSRLQVAISREGDRLQLAATITFGGRPDDIVLEPQEVELDGRHLRFVDPDGPNDSRVEYAAVYDGFALVGTAEISKGSDDLYGLGSFELRKLAGPAH